MSLLHYLSIGAAGLFVAGLCAVYLGQRRLMYFPDRVRTLPAQVGLAAVEERELATPDGARVIAWYGRARPGQPTLLYFHGNAGNVSHRLDRTRTLVEALDVDVALIDYRGYGRSDGRPGEAGLYADGEAIYAEARARGFSPDRIVLFGESLGSAVAIETALRQPARALILEAPFLSVRRMARALLPIVPTFLLRTRFDNESKIGRIGIPKLVAGSDRDDVVPFSQTRRLFELAAEPKTLHVVRGASHNNIYIVGGREYLDAWKTFLAPE